MKEKTQTKLNKYMSLNIHYQKQNSCIRRTLKKVIKKNKKKKNNKANEH